MVDTSCLFWPFRSFLFFGLMSTEGYAGECRKRIPVSRAHPMIQERYVINTDSSQQAIALKTGTVDIVTNIATANLGQFDANSFTVYDWTQLGLLNLQANCSEVSIMNDINMRLAVFYAIDVDGLSMALGSDSVLVTHSLFGAAQMDYLTKWDSEKNYETVTDYSLVKDYLTKAGYKNQEIKMYCEVGDDNNAMIIMQNMLVNAGLNVSIQAYDNETAKTILKSSSAWDLRITKSASPYGAVAATRIWTVDTTMNKTPSFVEDAEWDDMLTLINTINGHTEENIDAWEQHAIENAYGMGLYSYQNHIVFNKKIVSIARNGKNVLLPGGFEYAE